MLIDGCLLQSNPMQYPFHCLHTDSGLLQKNRHPCISNNLLSIRKISVFSIGLMLICLLSRLECNKACIVGLVVIDSHKK